jgi:hypothetical protein
MSYPGEEWDWQSTKDRQDDEELEKGEANNALG